MLDIVLTGSLILGITAASTIGMTLFAIAIGKVDV